MFRGETITEVAEFRVPEVEVLPAPLAEAMPADLLRLIVELLAPDREARPASGGAVRARLLELQPLPSGQSEVALRRTGFQS